MCGCNGGFVSPGTPAEQAGITVIRTTSFDLDGTEQFPTFDTLKEADSTGLFAFTPGTDVITLLTGGSYRLSVYFPTNNDKELNFKVTIFNNGVEIPDIFTGIQEGTDQPGIDHYNVGISLQKITLAAGTLKVMVQEVSSAGVGTNQVLPNLVWSMAQNSGVAGANGTDAAGSFTRDEFFIFRAADSAGGYDLNGTPLKNVFLDDAQAISAMSILYDKGGIVNTTTAQITPTAGTWAIKYLVKCDSVENTGLINGAIFVDGVTTYAGTETRSGDNSSINSSIVDVEFKTDGTKVLDFRAFSSDNSVTVLGGTNNYKTYVSGHRINTDPT